MYRVMICNSSICSPKIPDEIMNLFLSAPREGFYKITLIYPKDGEFWLEKKIWLPEDLREIRFLFYNKMEEQWYLYPVIDMGNYIVGGRRGESLESFLYRIDHPHLPECVE